MGYTKEDGNLIVTETKEIVKVYHIEDLLAKKAKIDALIAEFDKLSVSN